MTTHRKPVIVNWKVHIDELVFYDGLVLTHRECQNNLRLFYSRSVFILWEILYRMAEDKIFVIFKFVISIEAPPKF